MTYMTIEPLRNLARMQNEMARAMSEAFEQVGGRGSADGFVPPVDIVESKESVVLLADLPGVKLEDVDVSVENRTLTLSGARKPAEDAKDGDAFRLERPVGRFTRTFSLPATVDVARIAAEAADGVLRISIPKAADARPRRIEIARR